MRMYQFTQPQTAEKLLVRLLTKKERKNLPKKIQYNQWHLKAYLPKWKDMCSQRQNTHGSTDCANV
jgi:hypothetical protein